MSKTTSRLLISDHAVERVRERWPDVASLPDAEIRRRLSEQIYRAERNKDFAKTPGGTYFPITFLGKDGYAVFNHGMVTTVEPEEWCPHANVVRKQLAGE